MYSLLAIARILQERESINVGSLEGLGINLVQILAQVVNFLLILYFLNGVIIQPLLRNLEARRKHVEDSLENARKADERLIQVEQDYQARLVEASAEAQQAHAQILALAQTEAIRIRAEAETEIEHMRAQARIEAQTERDQILATARAQIVSLVMAATHKVVGESLDAERQRALITDFFVKASTDIQALGQDGEAVEDVTVISAVLLSADEQARVTADLGAGEVRFEVDPAILGGLVVHVGHKLIDGSIRGKLSALDRSLRS